MAPRGARATFVALFLGSLTPGFASAQVTTGALRGTVRDPSDAVLAGASVTVESTALPEGPLTRTTDERGEFRFAKLSPGLYGIRIETAGFEPYREENVRVVVGGTVERNVVLSVSGLSETVSVTAPSGIVDPEKAGVSTNYGSEYLRNIPVRRSDALDLVNSAPGVSDFSIFGSGTNENLFLLDGANFTSPSLGTSGTSIDTDVVEEVEILSSGASAEYGNFQGAVVNLVTRQGGSEWRFDLSYFHRNQRWTSQPIRLDCRCDAGETGYTQDRFHDFSAHLGGPILPRRLWVFGGFERLQDHWGNPGTPPEFLVNWDTRRLFYKLTWQVSPELKLTHSFHDDIWSFPDTPSAAFPLETLVRAEGHTPAVSFVSLSHVLSENTLWDLRISGSFLHRDSMPNSGREKAFHYDLATGQASGGSYGFGSFDRRRIDIAGALTHYAQDFLEADHDFKFGVQFVRGGHDGFYGYPGGVSYYDYAGEPYLGWFRKPFSYGSELRNLGAFAEDTLHLGERLTVNLGIRFDGSQATSPDIPAIDARGEETGETLEGLGALYTWNVFSPRLGFSFDLAGDGMTLLRGSFGRFYQGILAHELDPVHPGWTPITVAYFDPATGRYSDVAFVIEPFTNVRLDPKTTSPNTDSLSIGFDRELAPDVAISATYMRKSGRHFTGWEDIGGVYGNDVAVLQDGRSLVVYPLLNDPSERLFLLTNPEGWFLRYDGLLLTLKKRWSARWQALLSYTLSEAEGLQASSGGGPGAGQNSAGGLFFNRFGRDPNDLTNATGTLGNDRTHMFRVQAAVEIPKIDVLLSANFQQLTGNAWAGVAFVRLPQGTRPIFVETRGTRRLPSQTLLDFRISKIFRFGEERKLELLLDVLNLLDETAATGVVSTNVFSPQFGEGSRFVTPRQAMLGIRFRF
jgi:outer membrane receptor protein involved in Fe transport